MLSLRFGHAGERAPQTPAAGTPGVHVWHNRRGGIVATGFNSAGYDWMAWPYLATYRFRSADPFITAFLEPNAPMDVVWDTYRRSVLPMALQATGLEALHASAVVSRSRVIAFCAVSETGKSTVAFGLRRRGFPQWSDDAVVFQADPEGATALPLPFEVRLRSQSREMFGHEAPAFTHFEDDGPGEQVHTDPAPLGAICLLSRADRLGSGDATDIRALDRASAFPALLTHAHVFNPFDEGRRRRMLQTYLDLVATVPVYEVAFAAGADRLSTVLDEVATALQFEASSELSLRAS
jgi:hypothetical protein